MGRDKECPCVRPRRVDWNSSERVLSWLDPGCHPAGQWNTYEVRCDGPKILLWVNGELTSEFSVPEVPRGYLGLEAEGFQVEFRNLQLKILP